MSQLILIFGGLGDLFRHFGCMKIASVFRVLAVFICTLSGLVLMNQLQGFLVLEPMASVHGWASFQAKLPAFSSVSED